VRAEGRLTHSPAIRPTTIPKIRCRTRYPGADPSLDIHEQIHGDVSVHRRVDAHAHAHVHTKVQGRKRIRIHAQRYGTVDVVDG
jgi:hypothetical protein